MNLKTRIQEDMKTALKAKETNRLGAIRMLMAAIRQREIDERVDLDDANIAAVIEKMIKQRKESLTHFESAGREDLASRERDELATLNAYLPEKMSEAEVSAAIDAAIQESGAAKIADMGKLMTILKARLTGRTDMARVSVLVKARLS